MRRPEDRRWVAGAAAGIADWLAIDPVIVRVAVVCLTFLFGAGAALYLVAWVLLPTPGGGVVLDDAVRGRRPGAIALCVAAAVGVVATLFSHPGSAGALVPLAACAAGAWYLARRRGWSPGPVRRPAANPAGTPTAPGAEQPQQDTVRRHT